MTEDAPKPPRKRAGALGSARNPADALRAKHTTPRPTLSFEDALALLRAANRDALALEPKARKGLLESLGKDPAKRQAALAFLAYYLTPLRSQVALPDDAGAAFELARALLRFFDADEKRRFLGDVAMNLADPTVFQFLKEAIRAAYTPAEVEAAVLENAASANDLHAVNALELPYFVFASHAEFNLSDAGKTRLAAIRSRLRSAPDREALRAFLESRH
ncbi:hypothetical protein HY251_02260 [bacterium]|nr:hypothetical protein [bacterium]